MPSSRRRSRRASELSAPVGGPETRFGGALEPRTPPGRSRRPASPVSREATAPAAQRALHTHTPRAGDDGDPPALDLAELGVGHLDLQRQPGCPHGHLQRAVQVLVGEGDHGLHPASHLLPVDKHVVAAVGHLCVRTGTRRVSPRHVPRGQREDAGGRGGARPLGAPRGTPRLQSQSLHGERRAGDATPPGRRWPRGGDASRCPVLPHRASCAGPGSGTGSRGKDTAASPGGALGRVDGPSCVPAGARRGMAPPARHPPCPVTAGGEPGGAVVQRSW